MLTINHFQLTNEGIQLRYSVDNQNRKVFIENRPACEMLKATGIIQDFTEDKNHEPVVRTSNADNIPWCRFIKLLSIDTTLPQKIAEYNNRHFIKDKELILLFS